MLEAKEFVEKLVRERDKSLANLETTVKRDQKEKSTELNNFKEVIEQLDNRIKVVEMAVAIETYRE